MKKIIFLALITFISCSNESDTLNESVQLNANEQEGDVLNNNKVYDSMPEMNIDTVSYTHLTLPTTPYV